MEDGGRSVLDASALGTAMQPRLHIGFALLPKKVSRYLTKSMRDAAAARGIALHLLQPDRPLSEQGHFDAIIHKLRPNPVWEHNLHEYARENPAVRVVDRLDAIRTLQNRATMLTPLQGGGIMIERPDCKMAEPQPAGVTSSCMEPGAASASNSQPQRVLVLAPVQVEIPEGTDVAEAEVLLSAAGLHPPLLIKPVWTDGREGSHGLAVLHKLSSLPDLLSGAVSASLKPPLVVQQYVQHGPVIYKVYVVGSHTIVAKRPSLGELYLGQAAEAKGVVLLPRISCKPHTALAQAPTSPGKGSTARAAATGALLGPCRTAAVPSSPHMGVAGGLSCPSRTLGEPSSPGRATMCSPGTGTKAAPSGSSAGPPSATATAGAAEGLRAAAHMCSPLAASPLPSCAPDAALLSPAPCLTPPLVPGAVSFAGLHGGEAGGRSVAPVETPAPGRDMPQHSHRGVSGQGACDSAGWPADWMASGLAATLRSRLAMQLFNFDLICPHAQLAGQQRLYYVIDINYFPGVDKIPDFQSVFVQFLAELCEGQNSSMVEPPCCSRDVHLRQDEVLHVEPATAPGAREDQDVADAVEVGEGDAVEAKHEDEGGEAGAFAEACIGMADKSLPLAATDSGQLVEASRRAAGSCGEGADPLVALPAQHSGMPPVQHSQQAARSVASPVHQHSSVSSLNSLPHTASLLQAV